MSSSFKIFFALLLLFLIGCESSQENKETTIPRTLPPEQNIPQTNEQPQINKQANIDENIAKDILAVIYENIEATKAEDTKRVLSTIHKDSPQRNSTVQGMEYVFKNYDLDYILEEVEVLEITGEDAKVYYVQFTKAIAGQGFSDNRADGIHHMKKENGKWKIYKTENLNANFTR
jgi:hypothetical protein